MVTHISFCAAFGGDTLFSAYIAYSEWETSFHKKLPAIFEVCFIYPNLQKIKILAQGGYIKWAMSHN